MDVIPKHKSMATNHLWSANRLQCDSHYIAGDELCYRLLYVSASKGSDHPLLPYTDTDLSDRMNANSALAGMMFVRSWFGAGFPLFAGYMFHGLGVSDWNSSNWASLTIHQVQLATTTLACISVALAPVPFVFYKFGATIRRYSKFVPD